MHVHVHEHVQNLRCILARYKRVKKDFRKKVVDLNEGSQILEKVRELGFPQETI
jgi:hypothetical protein